MSKTIGIDHLAREIANALYGPRWTAGIETIRKTLREHLPEDVAELHGRAIALERANQAIHDRAVQEIAAARREVKAAGGGGTNDERGA